MVVAKLIAIGMQFKPCPFSANQLPISISFLSFTFFPMHLNMKPTKKVSVPSVAG